MNDDCFKTTTFYPNVDTFNPNQPLCCMQLHHFTTLTTLRCKEVILKRTINIAVGKGTTMDIFNLGARLGIEVSLLFIYLFSFSFYNKRQHHSFCAHISIDNQIWKI